MATLEFHPVADIFPMMSAEEFAALKADIADTQLREPIWLHPDGRILDGRNRYRACYELGLVPDFRTYEGALDTESLVQFVVSLNLRRRHLDQGQLAVVALAIEKVFADEARERQVAAGAEFGALGAEFGALGGRGNKRDEKKTPLLKSFSKGVFLDDRNERMATAQAAAMVGTNSTYVSWAKSIAREAPDLIAEIVSGGIKLPQARRMWKARVYKSVVNAIQPVDIPSWLLIGDFRIVGAQVPSESIDLIFTDPPYDAVASALFDDLARFAARVLKPGGILLTYSGQLHLPQIYAAMGQHLEYMWTCAIGHSAGSTWFRKWNLSNQWKPVLMYGKPPVRAWWLDRFDDYVTGGREKDAHEWQQALSEAEHYIAAVCPLGGVVLDPFLGSGTTTLAAKGLGMQYIGIEIDPVTAARAKQRVEES